MTDEQLAPELWAEWWGTSVGGKRRVDPANFEGLTRETRDSWLRVARRAKALL